MRTARSRTSGEYLFEELIALSSQVIDSPEFSARFTDSLPSACGKPCSLSGADWSAGRAGVSGARRMQGTLVAAGDAAAPETLLDALREGLAKAPPAVYGAASILPNGCGAWTRLLAADGAELTETMTRLWAALRERVTGHLPARRRK